MDDFIKEPDRFEFVDSDHILNCLESFQDNVSQSSLMNSDGSTTPKYEDMDNRIASTEGLLDNLIKSVCAGIDESTLIEKDENISTPVLEFDNSSSEQDADLLAKTVNLIDIETPPLSVDSKKIAKKRTANRSRSSSTDSSIAHRRLKDSSDTKKARLDEEVSVCEKENTPEEITNPRLEDNEEVSNTSEKDDCEVIEEKCASDNEPGIGSIMAKLISTGKELQSSEHAFQINDNMKKGLSKLAFPSKSSFSRSVVQKKNPSHRPISNTRITIGEALEKAQDVQNNASSAKNSRLKEENLLVLDSSCLLPSTINSTPSTKDDPNIENKTKARTKSLTRSKLTPKMWELLKFTFHHEHFPSSVHMARLAKMMGATWSQIRNWFTNRRVENKKNCIFPRDKALETCPYCDVTLKTEAEQKGHLFTSQHVKKILGSEFVSSEDADFYKWKPSSKNNILSSKSRTESPDFAGFATETDSTSSEGQKEGKVIIDKLGKLWKDSFLLTAADKKDTPIEEKRKDQSSNDSTLTIKQEMDEDISCDSSIEQNDNSSVPYKINNEEDIENIIDQIEEVNSIHLVRKKTPVARKSTSSPVRIDPRSSQRLLGPSNDFRRDKFKNTQREWPNPMRDKRPSTPEIIKSSKSNWTETKSKVIDSTGLVKQRPVKPLMLEPIIGYRCPTCVKIFQTEWQMIKHSMTHLLFLCDICEVSFPSEVILKVHLHQHLTGAYEEEKYYSQFSCQNCHSLKCCCYEPQVFKPKEIPKVFKRPQMARRSKKTFISKPFSGPNDHLSVTFTSYQRFIQNSGRGKPLVNLGQAMADKRTEVPSIPSSSKSDTKLSMEKISESNTTKENVQREQKLSIRKALLEQSSVAKTITKKTIDVTSDVFKPSTSAHSNPNKGNKNKSTSILIESMGKRVKGRPVGSRNVKKNSVLMDADFYYMCEMCDSSFLSKKELQEHMFFHRLKSRSRRGDKRGLEEDEGKSKKLKLGEGTSKDAQTINVVGFERFKCPKCKSHFANVTDLNRHKTQKHSVEPATTNSDSVTVLKCNYCGKTYRRERELRRHMRHACPNFPASLKADLAIGVTLLELQEGEDGPHYSRVAFAENEVPTFKAPSLPVVQLKAKSNGPFKCRYCPHITRREREMKRHIWKYCTQTPKIIKQRCKQGLSLEELGFNCQEDEVEDLELSGIIGDTETEAETASPSPSPSPSPSVEVAGPSPSKTSSPGESSSKGPLVCCYCGIWYYREISLVKHMKERCIIIPPEDKKLLEGGAGLVDTTNAANNPRVMDSPKGLYKKVKGSKSPIKPILTEDPKSIEDQSTVGLFNQSNEDLKSKSLDKIAAKKERSRTNPQDAERIEGSASPTKAEMNQSKKSPKQKGTQCIRCHESFISATAVLAHSSIHHGPKKGFYKCKLCQERFQQYKRLREHVWEHTQERPYKCHICDSKFRMSDSILEHLLSIHNYTGAHEKNLFKWLPNRNGQYRTLGDNKETPTKYECEESLEGMDTNLENLAEDMVVTDKIWSEKISTPTKNIKDMKDRNKPKKQARNDNSIKKTGDIKSSLDVNLEEADSGSEDVQVNRSPSKTPPETRRKGKIGNESTVQSSEKKSKKDEQENLKASKSPLKTKERGENNSNDDDEFFTGMGNLDSIIETVNLTDNFLD